VIRRLLLGDRPQETRFFVFVGGFGIVLSTIYWLLTREIAGTVLLAGFGLGAALIGVGLLRARPPIPASAAPASPDADPGADVAGGGTGGIDTPFADESGRLPGDTLAPLALGAGLALALTAVVFGPWLLVAGLAPLAWGAWTWLSGARDELQATEASAVRRDTTDSGRAVAVPRGERAPD
jgi:hypothetical protein